MKPRLFKTQEGMTAFMQSHASKGGVFHVLILHDDACSPSRCTCSPWYEVRPGTVENFIDGAKRQDRWIKETAS